MVAFMPLQYLVSLKYTQYQSLLMKASDRRVHALNQLFNAIRYIKYLACEDLFLTKVLQIRDKELGLLFRQGMMWSLSLFAYFLVPVAVSILTFSSYVFIQKGTLTAAAAFTTLSVLNLMRANLDELSDNITDMLQCKVSFDRILSFLNKEDRAQPVLKMAGSESKTERFLGIPKASSNCGM